MALQLKRDNLTDLDESLHSLYTEKDGVYHLNVDGIEDTGALKRAKEHEIAARKAEQQTNRDMQAELDALRAKASEGDQTAASKAGVIGALEKYRHNKLEAREHGMQGEHLA